MATTPEGKVKDKIKEVLKKLKAHYQMPVTGGYGKSGDPDFSICFLGLFIGIEAKALAKNEPTTLQKKRMLGIRMAGGITLVVHAGNVEHLEEFLYSIVYAYSQDYRVFVGNKNEPAALSMAHLHSILTAVIEQEGKRLGLWYDEVPLRD